jgi:DNA-binding NtrC family response regulator
VVIADDDDDCRRLLAGALRRDGFEVFEARDGDELIGRVTALRSRGHVVNAVVSDIGMPNCDGLHAMRKLRTASRALPIVLVTGFTDVELQHDAYRAGATAVLQKPVGATEITRAVRRAMSLPSSGS